MVPFERYIQYKNDSEWDFFNAMMGSKQFGELAAKYGVQKYIFGHIHTRHHETYKGIEMICNPPDTFQMNGIVYPLKMKSFLQLK
jgi:hypothetical protein